MKTFQQFCEDAYQLNEVSSTATVGNPIQRGLSTLTKSPIINNPVTRTAVKILGPANRVYNASKLFNSNLGPLEKIVSTLAAVTPPGPSNLLSYGSAGMEMSPEFRKFDKKIITSHEKAYKENPQGYTQMLGRSF